MKHFDYVGEGVAVILTATQTNEIFQTISLILTCVSIFFSLIYTIYKWYKEAKKDGKITVDEVKDLSDKITEHVENAKENLDKEDKE